MLCFSVVGSEVALTHNKSGRFESRFVSVGILPSPAVMLKGMEGSALGVWVAHGEGESVHVKNITQAHIHLVGTSWRAVINAALWHTFLNAGCPKSLDL